MHFELDFIFFDEAIGEVSVTAQVHYDQFGVQSIKNLRLYKGDSFRVPLHHCSQSTKSAAMAKAKDTAILHFDATNWSFHQGRI
jgi:hypothetical protein